MSNLCVQLESASPGELEPGGAGWTLLAGFAGCPFGVCLLAEGPRGICHLSLLETGGEAAAWEELGRKWFGARLERDGGEAERLAGQIFRHPQEPPSGVCWKAFVRGTAFQVRVWRALLSVPPGALISYGQLAGLAGAPGAARAVGSAVAANPLAWLIPCHRVIRQTGALGEYRWGRERKRAMIAWETAWRRNDEARMTGDRGPRTSNQVHGWMRLSS